MGADRPRPEAQVGDALNASSQTDGSPQRLLYGRRKGRPLRAGRAALLAALLPQIEVTLPDAGPLAPAALFDAASREIWLEVGFGAGEHLAAQALAHPEVGFIGCEPFADGVAKLAARIAAEHIANIRVFRDDARLVLAALPDMCLARAFVLFPDPWPKARHNKRRFLSRPGFAALARVLEPGAELRVATDDESYRDWIVEHATAEGSFARDAETRVRPAGWPATRYEEKALAAGRRPAYLAFRRR